MGEHYVIGYINGLLGRKPDLTSILSNCAPTILSEGEIYTLLHCDHADLVDALMKHGHDRTTEGRTIQEYILRARICIDPFTNTSFEREFRELPFEHIQDIDLNDVFRTRPQLSLILIDRGYPLDLADLLKDRFYVQPCVAKFLVLEGNLPVHHLRGMNAGEEPVYYKKETMVFLRVCQCRLLYLHCFSSFCIELVKRLCYLSEPHKF